MKAIAIEEKTNNGSFPKAGYNLMVLTSAADGQFGPQLTFNMLTDDEENPIAEHGQFLSLTKKDTGELNMTLINDFMEAIGKPRFKPGEAINIPDVPTKDFAKPLQVFMEQKPNSQYLRIPYFVKGGRVFIAAGADGSNIKPTEIEPPKEDNEEPDF